MEIFWFLVQGISHFSSQCVWERVVWVEKMVTHRLILKSHVDLRNFSMTPRYLFQVTNRCSKDIFALITQGTLAIERASGENCHWWWNMMLLVWPGSPVEMTSFAVSWEKHIGVTNGKDIDWFHSVKGDTRGAFVPWDGAVQQTLTVTGCIPLPLLGVENPETNNKWEQNLGLETKAQRLETINRCQLFFLLLRQNVQRRAS